jgi:hypothetical protein
LYRAQHTRAGLVAIGLRPPETIEETAELVTRLGGTASFSHLDEEQLVRVAHGQQAMQQRVDEAEHRGVGSNTQGEREHDDEGKARTSGRHAGGVADVPSDLVKPGTMTSCSDAFLYLFHTTEPEPGQPACLGGRRAVAHRVGSGHVDESLELIIQVLLRAVPAKKPSQNRHKAT